MKAISVITLLLLATVGLKAAVPEHIGKPFFQNITALEYDGHNRNFDILCDRTGRVLVANFEGLIIGDGTGWKMTHTPGISRITDLFIHDNGQIWVGGYNVLGYLDENDGLHCIVNDSDTLSMFGEVRNIRQEEAGITFDTEDGTYSYLNGQIVRNREAAQMTGKVDGVNCTVQIPDQNITASATVSNGVIFYDIDGNELYRVCSDDGLCSDNISAMAYDGKGTLWGTTDNGIFRISVSPVVTHFSRTDGLPGQVCTIFCSGNKLMVGTLQGLFIKRAYDRQFTRCQGIDLACWQIAESVDGTIFIAATQGLYTYKNGLERVTSRHTLSIAALADGSVITGEMDGMYRIYQGRREERINDIPNVLKFDMDDKGGIKAMNNYQQTFYAAGPDYIFRPVETDDGALLTHYRDQHGRYWHSGLYGDAVVCDELPADESVWLNMFEKNTIDAICVSGNSAFLGGNFGLIRMDLEKMKTCQTYIPMPYFRSVNIDDISLYCTFSADKTDPMGQVLYSYRIHADGDWSDWSVSNSLSFDHIQSGDYALSVRCRDSFGNISFTNPVYFVIPPPIYLRWYAIILYLITSIFLAMTYQQLRNRNLKLKEERLEREVRERTAALTEAQEKLLAQEREVTVGKLTRGLIDRILNPMNYITNFSNLSKGLAGDLKQDIEGEKENMNTDTFDDCTDLLDMLTTNLDKIEQHGMSASRILKSMEDLLQEKSGTNELTDMVMLCRGICVSFEQVHKDDITGNEIRLEWSFPSEPVMAVADRSNFQKALTSLLSNSLFAVSKKRTKSPDGDCTINISLEKGPEGNGCIIRIYDTGIGIESTIMDKIFDPFFTTKTTAEASGTGLYLCRQNIQDMGGTIQIASEKDIYTEVTITLPK